MWDCISQANTDTVQLRSQGIEHVEGGWPKDIDPSEQDQKDRYTKKVLRDDDFIKKIKEMATRVEPIVRENDAIDIYQEYFAGESVDHSSEAPSAKTVTVFRDPSPQKRTATHISWFPTDGRKIAVAYSVLQFQKMPEGLALSSYIWDLGNPNYPEQELTPASPIVCLEYNYKDPHLLVGGCYNGILCMSRC
jgi:dynein intermediate chain 2, axonemal